MAPVGIRLIFSIITKLTAHGNFLMTRLFFFYDLMRRFRLNFTDPLPEFKKPRLHSDWAGNKNTWNGAQNWATAYSDVHVI